MSDTNNNETQAAPKSNTAAIIAGIIALVAIVAGGYYYFTSSETTGGEAVAARVNDREISQAEYDRSARQISSAYAAQGIDVASADIATAIKEQAINTLVNRHLLLDASEKAGITASDAEIETEYQNVVTGLGGQEGLNTALTQNGITEADLRGDIAADVVINKYLESKLSISAVTVTDEEVTTAYDAAAAQNASSTEAIPPIGDVRELIREQLGNEKRQQLINTELERLRAEANIEVLV